MVSDLTVASSESDPVLVPDPDSCCVPAELDGMSVATAADLARRLKAVAEPTRLRLLSLVAEHEGSQACVCDLTAPVGLSQPTVSHHLKILVGAGLLTRSQRGSWAYYALVPGALDDLTELLRTTFRASSRAAVTDG